MGNTTSASSSLDKGKQRRCSKKVTAADPISANARKVLGDLQTTILSDIKKLEERDHPAAALLGCICGPDLEKGTVMRSYSLEDYNSEDDSRTVSEEETTVTDYYHSRRKYKQTTRRARDDETTVASRSYASENDASSTVPDSTKRGGGCRKSGGRRAAAADDASSHETEDYDNDTHAASRVTTATSAEETTTVTTSANNPTNSAAAMMLLKQPLASSFAKRCHFTKSGIGGHTPHYEGLTMTGSVVLMLAAAMRLKGCPTICDEDLRRVEQTYPNQFSRLPVELLLSSGWRRISKYCHFSNKPISDGVPFFHSKQRLHPSGGYYFLLAAAVGMIHQIDVEPLNRDSLVLLETDFPSQYDSAPAVLIQDPAEWTLVDKFCFFSGGPINTDEDVYYTADFEGIPIYMLAFLSPSLTPSELYKLDSDEPFCSPAAVQEVESVYDLTERDFNDLKLYHLGFCRALPQCKLQPQAWAQVLPPHFLVARETALRRAQNYEEECRIVGLRRDQHPYLEEDPSFFVDEQHVYSSYDNQPSNYGKRWRLQHRQHFEAQHQYSRVSPQQHGPQHFAPRRRSNGCHEYCDTRSHQIGPATTMHDTVFLREVEDGVDLIAPIDDTFATHTTHASPPAPLSSSLRFVSPRFFQGVSSEDPSHRMFGYEQKASESAFHQGFAIEDRSTFDDGVDTRRNYNYGVENLRDTLYQPGDEYDRQEELQLADVYGARVELQPVDEYNANVESQPADEVGDEVEFQPEGIYGDLEYQLDDDVDDRQDVYLPNDDFCDPGLNHVRRSCGDNVTPEPFSTALRGDEVYDVFGKELLTSSTIGSAFLAPVVDGGGSAGGVLYMSPKSRAVYFSAPLETTARIGGEKLVTSSTIGSEIFDGGESAGKVLCTSPSTCTAYTIPLPETTRRGNTTSYFPQISSRSTLSSECSLSSAVQGAHELLRRNCSKRHELVQEVKFANEVAPDGQILGVVSLQTRDSAFSGRSDASKFTSALSTCRTPVWTAGGKSPDNGSRRTLILQMARARMKSLALSKAKSTFLAEEEKLAHAREINVDLTFDLC